MSTRAPETRPGEPPAAPAGGVRAALHRHGPALLGYAAVAAVVFWPAVWHWRTQILGDAGDGSLYLWNMWAIPESLGRLENPFATDLLFHPLGARMAFNTSMPLVSVVSWPLQAVVGLAGAANLTQLAAVVLTGFGTYLLADHVVGDRSAAFVVGVAFTLIPYRYAHLAQFSLEHLEFLPFGLLALLLLLERPTGRRAGAYGAVVAMTFLTDLYYAVFLILASLVVAAVHWRLIFTRAVIVRLAQAAAVAAVVAAPLALAMVGDLRDGSLDPLTNWAGADNFGADLLSWIVPATEQRLWRAHVAGAQMTTGGERLAFPGFVLLSLAVVGAFRGIRGRRAVWIATAATFFVLSLGPFLRVAGHEGDRFSRYGIRFDIPLPYFVLHDIPVVNGVRVPGRFSVVAILAMAVLAAMALVHLAALRPGLARVVPAVALVLVLVEFWPSHIQTFPARVPAAYAAVGDDPGTGAVLEIPLQWRTGFGSFGDVDGDHTVFMYYATRHGKPLAGGMAARYPDRQLGALRAVPVYEQIIGLQQGAPERAPTFTVEDLGRLGIGYVVIHRDRPRPDVERYLSGLDMPVLADDGTVLVWKVPNVPNGETSPDASLPPDPGRSRQVGRA